MNTVQNRAEGKGGFLSTLKSYPSSFWVANTMEIFERMAWYGFFIVSSLYITGPEETGGLGFSAELRGNLQGIVTCCLYLMPIITGALADRYGYKKTFIVAFIVMIFSYYLLGQCKSPTAFFFAFMLVAVGGAIFKPVVIGTVARSTTKETSSLGFGIFYMMVNIGGFLGPMIAGIVRGWDWKWVFTMSSCCAGLNLILLLLFFKEPTTEAQSSSRRTLKQVFRDTAQVLGNVRFFITLFVLLVAVMLAGLEGSWFSWFRWWPHFALFVPAWILVNFVYDACLPRKKKEADSDPGSFLKQRMKCSNWRFALFLLLLSGFWTSYMQLFMTMPEYVRDFVDTAPLVRTARSVLGVLGMEDQIDRFAAIEEEEILRDFDLLMRKARGMEPLTPMEDQERFKTAPKPSAFIEASTRWLGYKVRITPEEIHELLHAVPSKLNRVPEEDLKDAVESINQKLEGLRLPPFSEKDRDRVSQVLRSLIIDYGPVVPLNRVREVCIALSDSTRKVKPHVLEASIQKISYRPSIWAELDLKRQFNPEHIVNSVAFYIILFQVTVSFFMAKYRRFTVMIAGMIVAAAGFALPAIAGGTMIGVAGASVFIIIGGLFVFAMGEMMASPTSQEYVGRIAPKDKVALYMGYYFVCMALGNLFGGILSGHLYGKLARDMQRPDLMWAIFSAIILLTAICFLFYNKFALPKEEVGN